MAALRFHWEFFGPDAQQTCEHFIEHLKEFCGREKVEPFRSWSTPMKRRYIATLECDEEHLVLVRDRLKPKRAERVG